MSYRHFKRGIRVHPVRWIGASPPDNQTLKYLCNSFTINGFGEISKVIWNISLMGSTWSISSCMFKLQSKSSVIIIYAMYCHMIKEACGSESDTFWVGVRYLLVFGKSLISSKTHVDLDRSSQHKKNETVGIVRCGSKPGVTVPIPLLSDVWRYNVWQKWNFFSYNYTGK